MEQRRFYVLLVAIMVFASFTRLMVIHHHQPDIIVEDEGSDLTTALRLTQGELPQSHVRYHRSLIAYQHLFASGVLAGTKWLMGEVRSTQDVMNYYFAHREDFILAARLWVGLLGVLGIGFVGLAGCYIRPSVGLWAAFALSLNGFLTANGVYALPDTLIVFASGLTLWLFMRLWEYRRTRDYIFVSLALALVMLSKLVATPIGIGVLVIHGAIVWQRTPQLKRFFFEFLRDKNLWIAGMAGILANVAFNPLAFLIPEDFIYEITRIGTFAKTPPIHILAASLTDELIKLVQIWLYGLPLAVVGVGLAIGKWRDVRYLTVLTSTLIVFGMTWRVMATMTSPNPQVYYWFTFMLGAALLIGMAMDALWQWGQRGGIWRVAWGVMVVFVLVNSLELAQVIRVVQAPLTQHQARDFIQATFTSETRFITADPLTYGVPLQRHEESIARAETLRGVMLHSWEWWLSQPEATRPVGYNLYGWEVFEVIETWADLRAYIAQEGIEYFITADYCQNFLFSPDAISVLDFPPHNDELVAEWELLVTFSPYPSGGCDAYIATRTGLPRYPALLWAERAGPVIRIYRVSR